MNGPASAGVAGRLPRPSALGFPIEPRRALIADRLHEDSTLDTRTQRPRRWRVAFAWLFAATAFSAQSSLEIEPNDTPAEATKVTAPTTLVGELVGNDQDGFLWSVSDVDALKRWTFELQGLPGVLTVVDVQRITWAANGVDVEVAEKLFSVASRDGTRPGVVEDLLFEPGDYVLGVAKSGGEGSYRLSIREGRQLVTRENFPDEGSDRPVRIGQYEHAGLSTTPAPGRPSAAS